MDNVLNFNPKTMGSNPTCDNLISGNVLVLFLTPPVWRSQIEAHEIHRGKELEVRLSLALSTIQVTVRISSSNFPEGMIDGDTTFLHLHNLSMKLKGRELFSSPLHS
ncbi:hypothetical protein TNCV_1663931 [Trichonephila clavipes]|uniref:Uncharacterized protein n=1 Tax=Trichonephila clavipes TaxID=2585209 RepID=A0A8X6VAG4_TRICX|nr:hypothetical protein TNCV_1663931 [Trichonephila clavipes]